MNAADLFDFEGDFVATLRCIPMAVRLKLDRCGVKLSLRQWSRFTPVDRLDLLQAACGTDAETEAYRSRLVELIALRTDEAAKDLPEPPPFELWGQPGPTPEVVRTYARSVGVQSPTDRQWAELSVLQRFVLVKLTRDNHDNVNFIPALAEFGLAVAPSSDDQVVGEPSRGTPSPP